ncbi:MAG: gamma-glutamylcyclotransferase, partial [Planctomycetota bacterium]|nr:gamma-glutamylcyclotransferase [Planctomycetota bacterium]
MVLSAFIVRAAILAEVETANYIFGYGSLINSESRAATAGMPTPSIPVRVAASLGFVRTWNFHAPSGFTALGLRPVKSGEAGIPINGVIYRVEGAMEAFDEREEGYDRLEVTRDKIEALFESALPPASAKIWVYVPQPARPGQPGPQLPSRDYPLSQSYIDVCLDGALEYNEAFAQEFLRTTEGWSAYWLNDRLLPRRPWVYQKSYKAVDRSLDSHSPSHTRR